MTVIINETGKREELHICDRNHIDWVRDCIGNVGGLHYDSDLGECTMTQADYDWWDDYLSTAQADYDEEQELRDEYGSEAVGRILAEEWEGDGWDYSNHHDIYQRAFARIRAELGGDTREGR